MQKSTDQNTNNEITKNIKSNFKLFSGIFILTCAVICLFVFIGTAETRVIFDLSAENQLRVAELEMQIKSHEVEIKRHELEIDKLEDQKSSVGKPEAEKKSLDLK